MKILITGQNGFIGKALFKLLQQQKHQVRGTVRNKQKIQKNRDIVVVGNIGPTTDWMAALTGIEVVVHLANRAHVLNDQIRDPMAIFREVNVAGTIQLAKQAVESGVRRFIFVSSIKVNGEQTSKHPFTVNDKPNPQDPYAVSKLEAENALREIAEHSSMEVVIIRPPLVYGQGVKGNYQRLIRLVELGVPLPFASIKNKRSLISLENLVQILAKATTHPAVANQTLLVSDGGDLSTPQLIEKIADSIGKPARLFHFSPKLLKILGKFAGQRKVIDRLCENLQIDGISNLGSDQITYKKRIKETNGETTKI
jgi:nucleoside-diphosphate-sugar epimerase